MLKIFYLRTAIFLIIHGINVKRVEKERKRERKKITLQKITLKYSAVPCHLE